MIRIIMVWFLIAGWVLAGVSDRQIANMLMLGFDGKKLTPQSPIVRDVCERGLGGVILFGKNISAPSQLTTLTAQLNQCACRPLIAVDQEGGTVRRIRFGQEYPRASRIGRMGVSRAQQIYMRMAEELARLGINYNLAPVADLDSQSHNYIIHKLGRSYGSDPKQVIAYNNAFIQAMRQHHILTALKHFPGHGSSLGDTHKGFVDVTNQWHKQELEPFWNHRADSVMMAHVVNRQIDSSGLPMSLSPVAIARLRKKNPNIVVITDDLQMGAIRKHYSLRETIRRAIYAGNDILLFGNQLTRKNKVTTSQFVKIVRELIVQDPLLARQIRHANNRIARMRDRIGLKRNATKVSKRPQHNSIVYPGQTQDDGVSF